MRNTKPGLSFTRNSKIGGRRLSRRCRIPAFDPSARTAADRHLPGGDSFYLRHLELPPKSFKYRRTAPGYTYFCLSLYDPIFFSSTLSSSFPSSSSSFSSRLFLSRASTRHALPFSRRHPLAINHICYSPACRLISRVNRQPRAGQAALKGLSKLCWWMPEFTFWWQLPREFPMLQFSRLLWVGSILLCRVLPSFRFLRS